MKILNEKEVQELKKEDELSEWERWQERIDEKADLYRKYDYNDPHGEKQENFCN